MAGNADDDESRGASMALYGFAAFVGAFASLLLLSAVVSPNGDRLACGVGAGLGCLAAVLLLVAGVKLKR